MQIPFDRLVGKWGARFVLRGLAIYVAVYVALSLCGRYLDNVNSLQRLGIYCLCISDLEEWQPALGLVVVTHHVADMAGVQGRQEANVLGYCFLPLVLLDRQLFHPTRPYDIGGGAE